MSQYDVSTILDEIDEFTPDVGFNLVSIDEFALPGEKLALIAHFDTIEEAKKTQEEYPPDKTEIYFKKN